MSEIKEAPSPAVPRWVVLVTAVAAVAALLMSLWGIFGRTNRDQVLRWSKGGALEETDAFLAAINHPVADRNQWQSNPSNHAGIDSRQPDYALPHVSVYSVPNIQPPHAQPTLRDLSDAAQARAIDAIERAGSKSSPWGNLKKAMSDQAEPGGRDPFLFDRVLVATVAKGAKWPPGDRMTWTRAFVTPINFTFAAYTIAATENETVKVSSVEATNEHKVSAEVELAVPGLEGSKIGLSPESNRSVKTSFDVNAQYERLGVDIMPQFLRIIRESGAGGDVIGNTKVALSLTTDPVQIIQKATAGLVVDPDIKLVVTGVNMGDDVKAATMEILPLVPLPHCALRATISAVYEQRHIQSGNQFYDESQQQVVFIHDVDEQRDVDLVGADDVSPFVWTIQVVPDVKGSDGKAGASQALAAKYVQNGDDGGAWRQLVFSDYGRAATVAHWVRTHAGQTASGYKFSWTKGGGLRVDKHTGDDCQAPVAAAK